MCYHHYVPDLDGSTYCTRCGDSPQDRDED